MGWQSFKCLDCSHNRRALAEEEEEAYASEYEMYGDYTYMFSEYELNFNSNEDWNEVSNDKLIKCTQAIPGFDHKVCIDMRTQLDDHKGAKISFAAASDEDIDDAYYDMYGYDMYYYNIDHFYAHNHDHSGDIPLSEVKLSDRRRLIEFDGVYEDEMDLNEGVHYS